MAAEEGIVGRGQAGIFGGSVNPLQVYMQHTANRQRNRQLMYEEERKKRDSLIDDMRKFNPDKVWEPFYDESNRFIQQHVKDYTTQALNAGLPASRVSAEADKRKGEALTLINKINWQKSQFDELGNRIDKDEYLDPSYYHQKKNDFFFNGMRAKPVNDIDTSKAEDIFKDSKGYRVDKIVKDFMTGLPNKINQHYTMYWDQLGQNYDIQETGTKLGLQYADKLGPDGKPTSAVVIDPRTGQPKISMTDDVFTQALGNNYLMNIVNDNLGPDASMNAKRAYLTGLLEGADPKQIKAQPRVGHKLDESDKFYHAFQGGAGYRTHPDDLNNRDELLDRVADGKGEDVLGYFGEATKDVKATYDKDAKGKPTAVTITYPSYVAGTKHLSDEEFQALSQSAKIEYLNNLSKSKSIQTSTYPIATPEDRRKMKIALSQRMDEIDKKRSIGQEYVNYINEKRDRAEKTLKKPGASGIQWK